MVASDLAWLVRALRPPFLRSMRPIVIRGAATRPTFTQALERRPRLWAGPRVGLRYIFALTALGIIAATAVLVGLGMWLVMRRRRAHSS